MNIIKLVRTNSQHQDLKLLVKELDSYLKVTDGDEHKFYDKYNHLSSINHFVVAFWNEEPAGCGAFKIFDDDSIEIKRMFTKSKFRRYQIGSKVLKELEDWAKEEGFTSSVLETGIRQKGAVKFYLKNNYCRIDNYGQYIGKTNSLCFKKSL